MTAGQHPQRPRRRWLRRIALTLGALLLIVMLALVAARLYFNDERLRRLVQEQAASALGAPVSLSALHLSLGSELTLEGLVVGPPPGFTRDVLTIGRAHLAWRLRPLFSKTMVVPDFTVSDVTVVVEENEHGRNLDAFSKSDAPPEESTKLEQPDIPLRVELMHVAFDHIRAEMVSPAMTASVDELGLAGSGTFEHRAMAVDLWMGLGSRDDASVLSHMRLVQAGTSVDGTQRLGLTLATTGLGDVRVGFELAATTQVHEPYALPELVSSATARATVNLIDQRAALEDTYVTIGGSTHLDLGVRATQILGSPTLAFDETKGFVDLDALAPFIAAFVPGTYRGTIDLTLAPMAYATDVTTVVAGLAVKANHVSVEAMGYEVRDLNAVLKGSLADGLMATHLDASVAGLVAAQGRVDDLKATAELAAPVAPFVDATADGPVDLSLHAVVGHANAAGQSASGVSLELHANGPAALVLGRAANAPWVTHTHLVVDGAAAQGYAVRGVDATADVSLDDLAGRSMRLGMNAAVAGTTATLPEGTVTLPNTTLTTKVTRRGQTFDIKNLDFAIGDLTALHAKAHIDGALGTKPRVKNGELVLADTRIAGLTALLPRALKPPGDPAGTVNGRVTISGTIPYVELTEAAQAPYLPRSGDVWGATIAAYVGFAHAWAARFDHGLPFSADAAVSLTDFSYDTAELALQGGKLDATGRLGEHGPVLHAVFEAATVATDMTMGGVRFELDAALAGSHVATRLQGRIHTLDSNALPMPAADTTLDFATTYDVDGDLVSTFSAQAPSLGAVFAAHATLRSPIEVAAARSWEQAGMPGLAVDVGWEGEMHNAANLDLGGGVGLSGNLSTHGALQIDRGIADFSGLISAHKLSAKAGENSIEELTGDLPFSLHVAFDERDGAAPLARGLSFGGGVASLVTTVNNAKGARPIYYASMRHYHRGQGLTIRRVKSGPYVVDDVVLDGGLQDGRLAADWFSLHVLGGDVVGNMAVRLGSDRSLAMLVDMKISNIDASTFSQLQLKPGPESELDADMHMTFKVAPQLRELNFDMNVTHIGSQTLDRFLQLLDPTEENRSLQRTRGQLGLVRIEKLSAWVRYENLNMDIDVRPFVHIPFTDIGIPNIDHQLLRRYSVSEQLDYYLQPVIDTTLAPLLGWKRAN